MSRCKKGCNSQNRPHGAGHTYQDHYFQLAKKEGYLSRAVYKLMEIQRSYRILSRGMKVLDLGAAPGSWLQFTSKIVGERGYVVGIDIKPIEHNFPPHVSTIQGDMTNQEFVKSIVKQFGVFDVVMSDMAPDTIGNKHADSARSAYLVEQAFELAKRVLKPGGHFIAKIFQGEDTPLLVKAIREHFRKVKIVKPLASRKESKEVYILAMDRTTQSDNVDEN
ncbi:MAG: RlmE family RNA methyltransferase [Syntrophobacterales bacterium]|nr:RlmE family RNA methyltransferase [Syntrophobacterales bacterium]